MPQPHPLSCRCGTLAGRVHPVRPANHCVCYCRDCRAFARHLGRTDDVLDEQGGTKIIQVPPAHVMITQGAEELACFRFTGKGLLRWYAQCCGTPIGNTLSSRNPSFVGLIHTCLTADGTDLSAVFGPITMRVNVRSALGAPPKASGLLGGVATILMFAAKARLSGADKTTPFFHRDTGQPVATPVVLTKDQREAARRERP